MCTPDTSRANLLSLAFAVSASRHRLLLRIILECIVCVLPQPAGFSLQLPTLGQQTVGHKKIGSEPRYKASVREGEPCFEDDAGATIWFETLLLPSRYSFSM